MAAEQRCVVVVSSEEELLEITDSILVVTSWMPLKGIAVAVDCPYQRNTRAPQHRSDRY